MSDLELTEAVEAAARAIFEGEFPGEDWLSLYPETRDCWILTARGPVAAAAPVIEAQVRADATSLEPGESLALMVATAQLDRHEVPTPNISAVCIGALERIAGGAR